MVEEARTASLIGKKPGASFKPSRPSARSSWTVSRKPSRKEAMEAKLSRQSVGLPASRATRKSPRKSGAIGNQLIIGQRGAALRIGTTGSLGDGFKETSIFVTWPYSSRHDRIRALAS